MMRYFFHTLFILILASSTLPAVDAEDLMQIHRATTTEMNNIASPQAGSLVYNTNENTLYFYTGVIWKRMRATGAETIINAGSGTTVTGSGTTSAPYTIGVN